MLKSCAVPKGVPTEPGVKRLVMQVDDHALEYGSFEGEIPAGQYGAGRVSIWDKGRYEADEWTDKVISFTLHGARHDGRYALVRLSKGKATEWLLFKRNE